MAFSLLQNVAQKALSSAGSFASNAIKYLQDNGGQIARDVLSPQTLPFSKTGQDIGASVGRALQQTPDTTIQSQPSPTYELFKKTPALDLLFNKPADVQAKIGEFATGLPGEWLRSWGRTLERVNTPEGRTKIAGGAMQIPEQTKNLFTQGVGKVPENASKLLSNPATEDALNASDIFLLGAGTVAKNSVKQAVKTGVKDAAEAGVKTVAETGTKKTVQTVLKQAVEDIPTKIKKTTQLLENDPENRKIAQEYLATNRPKIAEQPLMTDTDLAMKSLQQSRGAAQTAAEKTASVAEDLIQPVTQETKKLFQKGTDIARKWINTREGFTNWRAGDIKKTPALTQFDKEGIQAIVDLQSGANPARYKDVKDFTDGLYELENKAGLLRPDQYRKNYLPQMWENSPEEIDQAFKQTAGGKPGFSKSRVFEDYKTGIDAGLTPRFNTISDLLESRYRTAQRALADKDIVDNLMVSGHGKTLDKAPAGWEKVDLMHEGRPLAVDPQTAKIINNYLGEGSQLLAKTAEFVSNAKQTILSAGLPRTGWNFHTGVNVPARAVAASKNPFGAIVDSVIWNSNPKSALNYIEKVVPKDVTDGLLKEGLSISRSVNEGGYGFKPKPGKGVIAGTRNWFDKMFSEVAFDQVLPAHKLKVGWETYQKALKNGSTEQEAFRIGANTANEIFGGINPAEFGRSKDVQNLFRTLALAPDWLESNVRIAGKLGGLTNPKNWAKPEYAPYKRFAVNAAGMYTTMAITNKALSGHWPWENGAGQEFNLATGSFDDRGRERMVPAFGTAFDFLRIPYAVISSVAGNDPQQAINIIKNRLSPPASAALALASNSDYRGREIVSDQKSPIDNASGIAAQLGTAVGVPSQITNSIQAIRGESTPEELLANLVEAPLRYRGGAKSPTQRDTAALLKDSGASNEDIHAAFDNSGGGQGGGLFGLGAQDYKTLGASDGKIPTFKSSKDKQAFDKTIDTALVNGAVDLPDGAIVARFFDGKTYDKSARSGQQDILDSMLKVADDEYLTPEQKAKVANAAKINVADLQYYRAASTDQTDRLEGLLQYAQQADSNDRNTFVENLLIGKRAVGGKSLFSTTMYDRLYDEGLISKDEKALITAVKYDPIFDRFYMDRDYQGAGDGGLTPAKIKAYIGQVNTLFKNPLKSTKTKSAFDASAQDFADIQPPKLNLPKTAGKGGTPTSHWFTQY